MDIEPLVDAFTRAGVRLTATELADALMVAAHSTPLATIRTGDQEGPPESGAPDQQDDSTPPIDDAPVPPPRPIYDEQVDSATMGSGGMPVHLPSGQALPRPLEMARSLRPFKAGWRKGNRLTFDADKTVEAFAATGFVVPTLSPSTERWFDVNLAVDDAPSMKVWESTVREFAELLEQIGCFGAVRRWRLETTADRVTLSNDKQLRRVPAESLLALGSRQLTLVISDWTDPAWHSDRLWATLRRWARVMPTALLNPLPVRLWQRTNLTAYPSVLGPGPPGTPNAGLSSEIPHLPAPATSAAQWLALPTVAMNPHALDRWARMLMRSQPAGCAGVLIPREGTLTFPAPVAAPADLDPAVAVERFRIRSSPAAFRLATLCAIQPAVSLPVIQLIRQAMVPEADTGDIAEVVVSKLLVQRRSSSSGTLQFRFHEAARRQLLTHLSTDDAWQLFSGISRHLADEAGRGFTAMVAHPAGLSQLPPDLASFAEATDATLRLLGFEAEQERHRIIMQTVEGGRTAIDVNTAANEPALRITVLGRTAVFRDGVAQPLGPSAAALMVRLLLGQDQPVSVRELSADVWRAGTERPTLRSEPSIARRIREIRRAIDPAWLVMVSARAGIEGYLLRVPRAQVDMHEFEDLVHRAAQAPPAAAIDLLQQALAMWGQPMPEVAHLPYAQARIAQLQEIALTARRLLAVSYRDAGRVAEALQLAETYLAESTQDDPELTELARQLRDQRAVAEISGRHTYALYLRDVVLPQAPAVASQHLDLLVITAAHAATENLNACLTHCSIRLPEEADTDRLLVYAGRPAGILYAAVMVSDDSPHRTSLSDPEVRQALAVAARPLMTEPAAGRHLQSMTDAAAAMVAIASRALFGPNPPAGMLEGTVVEQAGRFEPGIYPLAASTATVSPAHFAASCELRLVEEQPRLVPRILLAVELAGYSRLTVHDMVTAQRRLISIVEDALSTVVGGLSRIAFQYQGDGVVCLLPADTDPVQAIPLLLDRMSENTARVNAAEPFPVKLRIALHLGMVLRPSRGFAEAATALTRLFDSEPLRRALADDADRNLAAVVSDRLHQHLTGHLDLAMTPIEYNQKDFQGQAWLWLPAAS